MSHIPESEPTSPPNPPKRPNPLDPSPTDPKKPKLNIDEEPETEPEEDYDNISDAELAKLGLVRADLSLTFEERCLKSWEFFHRTHVDTVREPLPYVPEEKDPLPDGWRWGSYDPASGDKQFVCRIVCMNCGKSSVHKTVDCPDKESPLALKFRKHYGLKRQ